jgi:zeaxanthin epoxidase
VRTQLLGPSDPVYSNYTVRRAAARGSAARVHVVASRSLKCYTGIADFVPPDVNTVGYRVFLGNKQYFVSSDVGEGRQQWYAFHCEPAGGADAEGTRKARLLDIFGHWCDDVVDLLKNTPEKNVLRRDIYDRAPIMTWSRGRVTLLGDSAHAMQPNLGQGGCMAIEDAYTLAAELEEAAADADGVPERAFLAAALQRYEAKRRLRVGTIHGMARMAAEMASTYKAYLGEGLGPLSFIEKLHIPHPGSASGKLVMQFAMPFVLDWVLGGNSDVLGAPGRAVHLRPESAGGAPRPPLAGNMTEESFLTYLADDDALLRAADADWLLVPLCSGGVACGEAAPPLQLAGLEAAGEPLLLGRDATVACAGNELVSARHATLTMEDGNYYLTDCDSTNGTWLNRGRLRRGGRARVVPGDDITLGPREGGAVFRVKMRTRATKPADQLVSK